MRETRKYNYEGAEFILETISDSVIRVTHREDTGYFDLSGDWEPNRPYTWTQFQSMVHGDSITMPMGLEYVFTNSSSDAAPRLRMIIMELMRTALSVLPAWQRRWPRVSM